MNATQHVHATQEKTETENGRQANGRFAPGNPGGPGNPYARQVAEYKKATLAVVSIERLQRILDAIAKKAEDGDVAAAKLILHYTLGKPTTSVDPDQVDVDEWQKLQKSALPPREMQLVLNGVPASLATRLTNIAWPCYVDLASQPVLDKARKQEERDAAKAKRQANAAASPSPDGSNGRVHEAAAPKDNGDNGGYPDWWDQAVQEEMERIRREEGWPSPDGENGGPATKVR